MERRGMTLRSESWWQRWFGGIDGTISPGFARCTMDKLAADVGDGTTEVRGCVEPDSVHTEVPVYRIDWVSDWTGELAFGDAAPPECPPADMTVPRTTPPPNL
jgi:hypothetical protein